MIDQRIDEQLRRLSRAIVDTSPEPPALTTGSVRRTRHRPIRASAWGFAVALLVGLATVLVVTQWTSGSSEPTGPAGLSDQSRWDWIVEHSDPTPEEGIRIADPSATPAPTFDYSGLGVEQRLISADPTHPTFNMLGDITNSTPLVYVGTIEGTVVEGPPTSAYVFGATAELTAQTMPCVTIITPLGAMTGCHEPDEATSSDQIISGTAIASEVNPPGISPPDLIVDFWLPLDTALVVLKLDDGRSFVQRPIVGIAVIEIQNLGDAGIEYAEALDASGQVMVHEDFRIQWEELVASLDSDTSTTVVTELPTATFDLRELEPVVVTCSTELAGFSCWSLIDGSSDTEWQAPNGGFEWQASDGTIGTISGATISFAFDHPYRITEIGFTNIPDDERFQRNVRIKGIEVLVDDLSRTSIGELSDDNSTTQWIAIESIRTAILTIRITSAYPGVSVGEFGPPFTELALAEISFRGHEVALSTETESPSPLPYLAIEVEGLDLGSASDSFHKCEPEGLLAPGRGSTYLTGTHPRVMFNVNAINTWCGEPIPEAPSDLGPQDEPFVIDHGLIDVMETKGRVTSRDGVFSVFWIVSDGVTAQFAVFPTPDGAVTIEDVMAIAIGVVKLSAEQWTVLVQSSPALTRDTIPRP